jgi:tetratricopeptide (TPR) repeat protein
VLSQELGSTPDARKLLRKALAIDSGNTAANYALGALEIGESNPDAALPHLLAALETTPTFMPALAMLAANYHDSHASQEIEDRLAAAIAADPDALPLRLLDLRLALEGGRGLDVLSKARAARDYFPEEVYLTYFEGTGYHLQGNTELAMANLRSAARKSPENPQFQYALAGAAFKAGESRVAREAIDRYRMLRPDDYRGVSLQALILEQSGKTDDALQLANAYAARRPQDARAFLLQGNLAFAQADYSAAEASFEAAAALEWSRDAAVRLAGARLAAGHENAAEPLQRWLAEHVDDSDNWRVLGQYLEEAGDIDGAVQAYEEVVDVGGDDAIALNNLAWQYALDGNRDAIALAERAHELAPDNGSVSDTMGWVLHLLGEHEQALEFLTLAAEQTPDDPDIQYRLAVSYAKNGNNAQAKAIISGILNRYESFQSRDDALDLINTL